MRAVIQRVSQASLTINLQIVAEINLGLVVLIGIEDSDSQADIEWMFKKISGLRIFNDMNDVMNLSVSNLKGELMFVSQFTLHASTKKGNRPSYMKAARPEKAELLFQQFVNYAKKSTECKVVQGVFGADMKINLTNDGPVTIIIDSQNPL